MSSTTLKVKGMSCEHCVKAVSGELAALDGVDRVDVDLVSGGVSSVTVHSTAPLPRDALREAVDEAGYELVED